MTISAGQFKAKCLKLMNEVHDFHSEIIITKFGKPIAKLVPVEERKKKTVFGCMKGSAIVKGNIMAPTGEKWNAESGIL